MNSFYFKNINVENFSFEFSLIGYDKKYTSYQSDGNESDTATDILVSAQPYEQRISPVSPIESQDHKGHSKYHRRSYSQRRDSLGSDCSSIEDVEESYSKQRLHNRSKSADGRGISHLFSIIVVGQKGFTNQKSP